MKQKIILLFFTLCMIPFLLEGLLRIFDPWGTYYYDDLDWTVLHDMSQEFPAGVYEVPSGKWGFTFDQTRRVPATDSSECEIVALGDSVTFGYGVEDDETWVNLLAQTYPEVEFINAGMIGYNTAQIYTRAQDFAPSGYLYLITYNDSDYPMEFGEREYRWYAKTKLIRYRDTWRNANHTELTSQFNTFGVPTPEPILYFLFGEMEGVPEGTISVPVGNRISFVDQHPNPEGHRAIFETIREPVGAFIEQVCGV